MRTDIIKAALVCGSCIGVGFGLGFLTKKYLDENMEDPDEFEPFEDDLKKDLGEDEVDENDPEVIKAKEKFVNAMDRFNNLVKSYNKYTEVPDNIEYEEYAAEREVPQDDEIELGKKVKKLKKPYLIDPIEYTDGNLGYEKFAYTYYRFDNVLTDEEDEPLDPEEAFGSSIIDFVLDKYPSGNLPFYIRNEETSCDYEVMFLDERHTEMD